MKPQVIRILRWLLPCAAVAFATLVVCSAQLKLDEAKQHREAAKKALAAAEEAKRQVLSMGDRTRYAAESASPQEQTVFLAGLRKHVALSSAAIVKWTSTSETYASPSDEGVDTSGKKAPDPSVAGLTRISSQLTLSGSYASLRSFLRSISKSNRLYTIQDVRWTREKNGCQLSMTLSRYVTPADQPKADLKVARNDTPEVVR